MRQVIWIEWIGLWGSGKSTVINKLKQDMKMEEIRFHSTQDYFIKNRIKKIKTILRDPLTNTFLLSKLLFLLLPFFIKAVFKIDKIAISEYRSFISCFLARLSFKYSSHKSNVFWEGEMHLIPSIELNEKTINKVIDLLLSINQEVIHAVVVMNINEEIAFKRINADKQSKRNIRFNKGQKFNIERLRRFNLFQNSLIEVLKEKNIQILESDGDIETLTKFIRKF
jgi:hypothetical protein